MKSCLLTFARTSAFHWKICHTVACHRLRAAPWLMSEWMHHHSCCTFRRDWQTIYVHWMDCKHTWLIENKLNEKQLGLECVQPAASHFDVFPLSFLFRSDYHSPLILHAINSHHVYPSYLAKILTSQVRWMPYFFTFILCLFSFPLTVFTSILELLINDKEAFRHQYFTLKHAPVTRIKFRIPSNMLYMYII